jgi:nucleotide-binding universal stress UspA family protein
MNAPARPPLAPIKKIFHPSDLTTASESAFRHALKVAQVARAELTVLHVAQQDVAGWAEFPGVRQWLERWRLIPPGSGRDAIRDLGLSVQKIIVHSSDTLRACLHYLDRHPAELIVLAAEQRETRAAWPQANGNGNGHAPRGDGQMTLFLPEAAAGFVYASDGAVQLRRILIAIGGTTDAQRAVDAAARLAHTLGIAVIEFTLVHIGHEATVPQVRTPTMPGWSWRYDVRQGDVAVQLLAAVAERSADLVVMTTDGTHGFVDALRGHVTEGVLHESHCPLLAVSGPSRS